MSTILVVDDRESIRDSVATTLTRKGHAVVASASAQTALEKLTQRSFDAVITDLQMPEMNGLELLAEIRRLDEQLPVILITAYGTVESVVQAMKNGAYDYFSKPFDPEALVLSIERGVEHARVVKENNLLRAQASPASSRSVKTTHEMIGDGQFMTQLRTRLACIADSHGTVLISGESGSGKEVAARWIHQHSPRASMPFLALNCAALAANLLESELFGHEKGAFTGADKLRKGRFELVDGGTLLLDEISEIPPEIQAKLLRVLQERSFERVGSSTSRSVDVRVIATTNRHLPDEVSKGRFRSDLYYRLNVLQVSMPPLREHADDIPALVCHILGEVAAREGKPVKSMDPQALGLLERYSWPGNVREMQNICERAAVHARDQTIPASLIAPWLNLSLQSRPVEGLKPALNHSPNHHEQPALPSSMIEVNGMAMSAAHADIRSIICDGTLTLQAIERYVIVATLEHNHGHRQRSARDLGIGVRTLGLKLKKWKEEGLVDREL